VGSIVGSFAAPEDAVGAVLVAVGVRDGQDPMWLQVADFLHHSGFATVVVPLADDGGAHQLARVAGRVVQAVRWLRDHHRLLGLPVGCLAHGEAVAPALVAGAHLGEAIAAVIGCSGHPDVASEILARIVAPTLLVVGEHEPALEAGRTAMRRISAPAELAVVDGAADPVADLGSLGTVCHLANAWLARHLGPGD
jgi:pimeloyl-ACP methyl ester carboxylesterase